MTALKAYCMLHHPALPQRSFTMRAFLAPSHADAMLELKARFTTQLNTELQHQQPNLACASMFATVQRLLDERCRLLLDI